MRRVVLDTNVLVAAVRSNRGAAFQLLSLVGTGRFEHVLSVALVFEYEAVLSRPATGVRLPRRAIEDTLDYLCHTGILRHIDFLWRPILADPNDDFVLEVAVGGSCDTIVTFNLRDFRGAERFGLWVQTPQVFLRSIGVRQ